MASLSIQRGLFAAAVLAGLAGHAAAQVTYFDKPPSPADLAQALRAAKPAPAAGTAGTQGLGGRGIEWKAGAAPVADAPRELPPAEGGGGAAPVAMAPAATAAATAVAPVAGPVVAVPVQFQSGSSAVSSGSMPYLDAIGMALAQDPSLRLVIEGHTDAQGDPRVNLMLSWERAFSVFKVLVQRHRIDPGRLQPLGRGALDPMQGTMPTDGVNRRVQFRTVG